MNDLKQNLKFTVTLEDGLDVETVFYGTGTLCVSCQVGCAAGCPFCASGQGGLIRNLSAGEMWAQVEDALGKGFRPARVTVSGIGEPLHNPEEVAYFMGLCRRQDLPASLTTIGSPLVQLERFLPGPDNGLMLSLHAGTAATHRRLLPGGPGWQDLWELLGQVLPRLSRRRRRKIGINYLVLPGVNDGPEEVDPLLERLVSWPELTLHLLQCNPVPGSPFPCLPTAGASGILGRAQALGINARRSNPWRNAFGGCGTLVAGKRDDVRLQRGPAVLP